MKPWLKPTHTLIEAFSRALIGMLQNKRRASHRIGPGVYNPHNRCTGRIYPVGHCGGKQECARRGKAQYREYARWLERHRARTSTPDL